MNESKIIEAFDEAKQEVWTDDDQYTVGYNNGLESGKNIVIDLLKEQKASTLGMKITADGITFTAEGDAKIGEQRGTMLGKLYMYDQIAKELLYANLWTEEIKKVFDKVKRKTLED